MSTRVVFKRRPRHLRRLAGVEELRGPRTFGWLVTGNALCAAIGTSLGARSATTISAGVQSGSRMIGSAPSVTTTIGPKGLSATLVELRSLVDASRCITTSSFMPRRPEELRR